MNKKIVTLVSCVTATAASAFAFIGCEGAGTTHKHTYTTSYVLAKCETDGYTLHTCSECGYKYADEFVDAYGHAYEYCVGLALHNDEPAMQADEHGGMHTFDISELIGQPLSSIVMDQTNLAKTYMESLIGEALAGSSVAQPQTQKFHIIKHGDCSYCGDGGVSVATIDVPMMSIVPIPAFSLDSVDITFDMEVKGDPLPDYWHDEHGFGKFDGTSKLDGNASGVISVPTQYHFDPETKTISVKSKKIENVDIPDGLKKLQLIMSDSIEEIGANAFAQCSGLRRCDLPTEIKTIGANAFGSAIFDYIIIPNTVESIGSNAFGACSNMKYVFYLGTPDEWNNITIDSGNDGFKNVKRFYYSETKPTTEGNYWHFDNNESPVIW